MRKTPSSSIPKTTTLADVARGAGVTKSTASFAFSGKRKISDATKERIFAVAKELGYHPNPHAQRLGAGRAAKLVGLFALTLDHMAWKTMSRLHHDLAEKRSKPTPPRRVIWPPLLAIPITKASTAFFQLVPMVFSIPNP